MDLVLQGGSGKVKAIFHDQQEKIGLINCYFKIIAQYLRNLIDRLSWRSVDRRKQ
jgi:hypothetical protein